ncbi:unnamed protein product, partial [Amoebophrya sp. A25]
YEFVLSSNKVQLSLLAQGIMRARLVYRPPSDQQQFVTFVVESQVRDLMLAFRSKLLLAAIETLQKKAKCSELTEDRKLPKHNMNECYRLVIMRQLLLSG